MNSVRNDYDLVCAHLRDTLPAGDPIRKAAESLGYEIRYLTETAAWYAKGLAYIGLDLDGFTDHSYFRDPEHFGQEVHEQLMRLDRLQQLLCELGGFAQPTSPALSRILTDKRHSCPRVRALEERAAQAQGLAGAEEMRPIF